MDAKEIVTRMRKAAQAAESWPAARRAEEQVVADAIAAEVARAVAEEREACARLVEEEVGKPHMLGMRVICSDDLAAAIRARGTKEDCNG